MFGIDATGSDGMGENAKVAVLVAGMHRSGTSATTRILNLLGCDLPGTLLEANPTNSAGTGSQRPSPP